MMDMRKNSKEETPESELVCLSQTKSHSMPNLAPAPVIRHRWSSQSPSFDQSDINKENKYKLNEESNSSNTASSPSPSLSAMPDKIEDGKIAILGDDTCNPDTTENSQSNPSGNSRYCYTKVQLLDLREKPASKKWPTILDPAFRKSPSNGMWDPERWIRSHYESTKSGDKKNVTQNISNKEKVESEPKRNARDPRERVKQEDQDDIVLSPQRRSFGTGCHGLQQSSSTHSGIGGSDSVIDRGSRDSHREIPTRRIGSGRIIRRDDAEQTMVMDKRDSNRRDDRETDQRRDTREWRSKVDFRYDKDDRYDSRRDRDRGRIDRDRGYHDRRKVPKVDIEEEPPEWFTGGPTSQNEFIELVGFDDIDESSKNKQFNRKEKRKPKKEREGSNKDSRGNTPIIFEEVAIENCENMNELIAGSSSSPPVDVNCGKVENLVPQVMQQPVVIEPSNDQDGLQFNIDDFLGNIIGFANADGHAKQLGRISPLHGSSSNSRKSSFDYPLHLGNLLSEISNEPKIQIPSPSIGMDSSRFFAPISPADKTGNNVGSVVDLLQQVTSSQKPQDKGTEMFPNSFMPYFAGSNGVKDLLIDGKGQSLEEVEANFQCQHNIQNSGSLNNGQPSPNNMSAFNDFLSHIPMPGLRMEEKNIEDSSSLSKFINGMKDIPNISKAPTRPPPSLPGPSECELLALLNSCGNPQKPLNMQSGQNSLRNSFPPASLANLGIHVSQSYAPRQQRPSFQQQSQHDLLFKFLQQSNQTMQQHQKKLLLQQALQQQQHMDSDPIKQLIGTMNQMNIGPVHSQQDQVVRDILLKPDVQNLFHRLINGQITQAQLRDQLASGNLNASQRETVAAVLKLSKTHLGSTGQLAPPRTTLTPSPTPGINLGASTLSPRIASPNPDGQNLLPPQMRQQTRLSPLIFSGNNLSVGGAPRRPPSHQELVAHTQSIMQKALLKQELERAKEKHRKRDAERARSPLAGSHYPTSPLGKLPQVGSPSKIGPKPQSPLAFTPTSVMRKMTAEKELQDKFDRHDMLLHEKDVNKDKMAHMHLQPPFSCSLSSSPVSQPSFGMSNRNELKRDMRCSTSSLNSVLGPKSQMIMNGQIPPNAPPSGPSHMNGPVQYSSNVLHSIGRGGQNMNVRGFYPRPPNSALLAVQMMRGQSPVTHGGPVGYHNQHHYRMPGTNNPSSFQQFHMNNNIPATSDGLGLRVLPATSASHRSSPVNNIMQLFAQVQSAGLPDFPGGRVLSLEEVERRQQQSQTMSNRI